MSYDTREPAPPPLPPAGPMPGPFVLDQPRPITLRPHHHGPRKARVVYILLGLFLGGIGIHNFYAGRKNAVTQLVLGLCGPLTCFVANIAVAIWALIEICTVTEDGNGVPFE